MTRAPEVMTSDAKRLLSATIRRLREQLLEDLHASTESTYRLSITRDAQTGLPEAAQVRRRRLRAWMREQERAEAAQQAQEKGREPRTKDDFRREAEQQAAYTLLNRLLMLRLLETKPEHDPTGEPLRWPPVIKGGWQSRAYLEFRDVAEGLVTGGGAVSDETEGYAFLLQLIFEEMALDLPGLFGPAGIADLVPIPARSLRLVIEALDQPELESCWHDDMTLGWVYQYWNDPQREALDAKLNAGGKVAPHEIASKTQMFTERYMVDWLLQNTLGPMWLAMCRRHGWVPEVEARGVLRQLDERRADWRAKREAGEVELTELMPLYHALERRWAYYVPQPIPDDAAAQAPESWRDVKILDPAVGSGHFLVVAMDLLVALYREEARHRGVEHEDEWQHLAIVECILSHNLHGIDLDPRAVQMAAAALWLKAQQIQPGARPERLNLVASNLRLSHLGDDEPALRQLRLEVERETGLSGELLETILHALRGADHLGSLLKIDQAVDEALSSHDADHGRSTGQRELFADPGEEPAELAPGARLTLVQRLEAFLARHSHGDDLGLRLWGEQLTSGVRFLRMLREGRYDLVVGNPPYLGSAKLEKKADFTRTYATAKTDYFAAFFLRGMELAKPGGRCGYVTLSNWMFLKAYRQFREQVLKTHLVALADFGKAAFSTGGTLISTSATIFRKAGSSQSMALRTFEDYELKRDERQPDRTCSALLAQVGRHEFDTAALKVVPEWPLIYWWAESALREYRSVPLIGDSAPAKQGLATGNNARFLRRPFEVAPGRLGSSRHASSWTPYIKGAAGRGWVEPLSDVVNWSSWGLEIQNYEIDGRQASRPQNQEWYFSLGVAFSMIGSRFSSRAHRYGSIFGHKGSSIFVSNTAAAVCALNSSKTRRILEALNPGIGFEVGDVARVPFVEIDSSQEIFDHLTASFSEHEAHREPSVEFKQSGPSPWRHAQVWAQEAVDRPDGAPLPDYEPVYDPEPPSDHLSFALGVALGRFGASAEGILNPEKDDLSSALPHGLLFLDGTLDETDRRDGLGHPAAEPLHEAWKTYSDKIETRRAGLREWLRLDFFKDVHRTMYENRPIHWPLSSSQKTFVAWVNIHRMDERTLRILQADHLRPALTRLDGELTDLREVRDGAAGDEDAKKAAREAGDRVAGVKSARDELAAFLRDVEQVADRGAPQVDAKDPEREQDHRYQPVLDDGVMINSAALWPLLEPQWKDPKKWWRELSQAKGRKDYDWSQLAMRYWPRRVDEKCRRDPSLAVAHGCFWRFHPERAYAWELRLQDEIGPDFRIEEAPYRPGGHETEPPDRGDGPHRRAFLEQQAEKAIAAIEKEALRRMGRGKEKKVVAAMRLLDEGLWADHPQEMWALEQRLAEKQGADFQLEAPDEPDARATYEANHPEAAAERRRRFGALRLLPGAAS